jgi:hypothetical protein
MVNRWILGIALALGLLGGGFWLLQQDRAMRAILRRSDQLTQTLCKTPGDGLLALATRAHNIAGFFARKAQIAPDEPLPAIQSRDEIVSLAARTLQAVKQLKVRILDRDVAWVRPQTEAVMRVAVEVTVEGLGERQDLLRTYELTWIREEEEWVIANARPSEPIRRPAGSGQ